MGAAQSIQGQGQNNNNFYAGGESAAQPGTGQAGVTAIAPFNFIVSGQGGLAGSYASGASGTGQPLQLETWVKFKDGQHLLPDWVVEITGGQAVYNSPEFKAKAEKITFAKYMAAFSRQQASASLPTREAIAGNHLAAIRDLESGRLPAPTNKLGWDMRSRIK